MQDVVWGNDIIFVGPDTCFIAVDVEDTTSREEVFWMEYN
jgi:hypothetical protein